MNDNDEVKESEQPEKKTPKFFTCKSCKEQCIGHGGGSPTYDGKCMCNNGVLLECLM
jgi:hypothetical protein